MQVQASLKFARITPRKMRLAGNLCKGFPVEKAHNQWSCSPKRGSRLMVTLLKSAVANAREKGGVDIDNLFVKNVLVDDGPIMKRFMPRSMGRAYKILKKMSHITLILDEAR
jgi:large subunit ribosomal protein L22